MLRKSLLAAAVLIAISSSASAVVTFTAGLSDNLFGTFNPTENNGAGPGPVTVAWGSGVVDFGVFSVDQKYNVTYTYLGTEAGRKDRFVEMVTNTGSFVNKPIAANTVGDTLTVVDGPGNLKFKFTSVFPDNTVSTIINGDIFVPGANPSWGLLRGATSTFGNFDYILGFNDPSRSDRDFDDMVVGMSLSPIPEPSTYALMLAGLGAVGFLARRRRSN